MLGALCQSRRYFVNFIFRKVKVKVERRRIAGHVRVFGYSMYMFSLRQVYISVTGKELSLKVISWLGLFGERRLTPAVDCAELCHFFWASREVRWRVPGGLGKPPSLRICLGLDDDDVSLTENVSCLQAAFWVQIF